VKGSDVLARYSRSKGGAFEGTGCEKTKRLEKPLMAGENDASRLR